MGKSPKSRAPKKRAETEPPSRRAEVLETALTLVSEHGVAGASLRKLAAELGISVSSVNTYRNRIFQKTGLSSNAALIRYALQNGLAQ